MLISDWSSDVFSSDLDGIEPHEANINAIADAGIAQGGADGSYGPGSPVTRSQMASFPIRHLAVRHSQGVIDPLPGAGQPPVATGLADGTISGNGYSCPWIATTHAEPPQTPALHSHTVNPPGGDAGCTTGMVPGVRH